jgi:hypothetical protein
MMLYGCIRALPYTPSRPGHDRLGWVRAWASLVNATGGRTIGIVASVAVALTRCLPDRLSARF